MARSLEIQANILSKNHSTIFCLMHRMGESLFTRKRSLSFVTMVSLILQKVTRSLQIEANLLGDFFKRELVTKQALSKARYKIGIRLFKICMKAR